MYQYKYSLNSYKIAAANKNKIMKIADVSTNRNLFIRSISLLWRGAALFCTNEVLEMLSVPVHFVCLSQCCDNSGFQFGALYLF